MNEQDQERQAGTGLEERDTLEALSRHDERILPDTLSRLALKVVPDA
jgi:hypothetical protein